LPSEGFDFLNVVAKSGSLHLVESLEPDRTIECLVISVNATSLRLSAPVRESCESPRLEGQTVAPYVTSKPIGIGFSSAQVARYVPSTGKVVLGPVLASYEDDSTSGLEWTYGPGTLWIYETQTSHGPMVFRVSSTTGKLLQAIRVPRLARPLLTADADGLYVAAAGSFGNYGDPGALVYRVAVGAQSASTVVRSSGQSDSQIVSWLTSDGDSLWMDVCTRPLARPCEIWKFQGPDLHPVFHVSDRGMTGDWVIGNSTLGLFTSFPVKFPGNGEIPTEWRLVRIDPSTGHIAMVASVMLPWIWSGPDNFGTEDVAFYRGSMYIANPPLNGSLIRVRIPRIP
jgi:hypothetical protein